LLDQALELLDLGEGDIDGQHGLGFLLSRSNGYWPYRTALTEPARLPPRLFTTKSARIVVRKGRCVKRTTVLTRGA
jgi:hypothetical protein